MIEAGTGPTPTKLESKDLIIGTGAEAKQGHTVYVNYVGALWSNGKEFDSSWKRNEPFVFVIGTGEVITGWDKGVVGMKVGGRRRTEDPRRTGLRKARQRTEDPEERTAVFVVDLLKVNKKGEG